MDDQAYAEAIIKGLVDNPDDVKIDRKVDDRGVLLTITTNKSDIGQVIGKQGGTINALRSIMRGFGAKRHSHVSVVIAEPDGTVRRRLVPEQSDDILHTRF